MPVTTQDVTAGYDGTYLYGSGQQRDKKTLTLTGNQFTDYDSNFSNLGYMPFDGTYLYYDASDYGIYGIQKIRKSDLTVVATYTFPTGNNHAGAPWITYDGTYLYALLYNDVSGDNDQLVQIDPSTMTQVNQLSLTNGTALLAGSLKNAVSWAFS